MKMHTAYFVIASLLTVGVMAQDDDGKREQEPRPARIPVWRAELPGGTYTVALRAITSVSVHEYVVDGAARVVELNIDTSGNTAARFFHIEPVTPESPLGIGQATLDKAQELLEEAADRTGQGHVWREVAKNYPTTTHAHTVEYRLANRDELDRVFKSVDNAFRQSKPATVKIKGE